MQNELNLQIEANAKEVDATLNKLISTLKKVDTTMNGVLKNVGNQNPTKSLEEGIDRTKKKADKLKSSLSFGTLLEGIKQTTASAFGMLEKSIDYSENLNLFNVALDDLSQKGMKFQNTINEAFGTNQSETLRFQGLFQAMSKSMGIANEDAYKLSEGLTKVGFDLSSLYNISDVSAMNKLRAGLAGQTEPLRTVGMDITENSLKPIIERLNMRDSEGELLTPRQLSYAEKMLLRYIAIVDQAKVSQGDFANTIEAPANQLKILGMQASEAGRALGNLFVGALAKILPYANAVVMVIKEVAKAIAGILGIEISDFNSGIGSLEDTFVDAGDSAGSIGDSLNDADKKAKKLQRTVMGFDQIHSISTPTASKSSGSDGGLGGSINPKLLAALGTYENGMEKVRMKATQIRDAIMDWLGFTKKINPLTGETYFEYEGISKTLQNMWKSFKGLSTAGKVLVGLGLAAGAKKLWTACKGLLNVIGGTGIFKWVKALFSPITTLVGGFSSLYKQTGWLSQSLSYSTKQWTASLTAMDKAKLAVVSLAGAYTSFKLSASGMHQIRDEGELTATSLLKLGGSFVTGTASGVAFGSMFGPVGMAIGGVVGALGSGVSMLYNYSVAETTAEQKVRKSMSSLEEYTQSLKEQKKAIEDTYNANMAHITYTQDLTQELDKLVDENGKVKTGYEHRLAYILNGLKDAYGVEYQLIDGIVKNYGDYKKSIQEVIETKKAEILLQAKEEIYKNALENRVTLWKKVHDAENAVKDLEKEHNKFLDEQKESWDRLGDSAKKRYNNSLEFYIGINSKEQNYRNEIAKSKEELEKYNKDYENIVGDIVAYENLQTAIVTENKDAQRKAIEEYTNSYQTESGKQKLTMDEEILLAQKTCDATIKAYKDAGFEVTEEIKNQAYNKLNILTQDLTDQTSKVTELSKPLKESWKALSEANYDVYVKELSKMSPEMREQIQKVTGVVIEKTPEVEKATDELSKKVIKKMNKSKDAKEVGTNIVLEFLQGLSEKEQQQLLEDCGVKNVDKVMKGIKKGDLSESVGIQIVKGLNDGLKNNKWQGQTLSTAFSFATNILNKFKKTFDIHSPSKKTTSFGKYLAMGIPQGLIQEKSRVLASINDFSNNVLDSFEAPFKNINKEIVFDEFKPIDITKTFNYEEISGAINSDVKIKFNDSILNQLSNVLYNAVSNQQVNVKVDVEARTEEGTIAKVAIKGINKETVRTGQCPIQGV